MRATSGSSVRFLNRLDHTYQFKDKTVDLSEKYLKKNYYYKRNIIIVNVRLLSLIVKIYLSGSVYNINALKNVPFGAADEEAEVIYTPRVILIKAMNIMIIKKREWVF